MAVKEVKQRVFNAGTRVWDQVYPQTTAGQVIESKDKLFLTAGERTKISSNLTKFNGTNQIVKTDATGKIPTSIVDLESKLNVHNPTFTGKLTGSEANIQTISNDDGILVLGGDSGIKLSKSDNGSGIDVDNQVIYNLARPTSANHAATKNYVDGLVALGIHSVEYCVAATTKNINISAITGKIDGIGVSTGDRVLIKDQTNASQNGIYTVGNGSGSYWNRVDADSTQGAYVFIANGNTYNDWYFTNTDNNTWLATGRPDTITAGTGLVKAGNSLSIKSKILDDIQDNVANIGTLDTNITSVSGVVATHSTTIAANTTKITNRVGYGDTVPSSTGHIMGDTFYEF